MKTHARVAAAALILAVLASGCSRTTEGTVAQTTEPGPTTTSRPSSSPSIPGLPDIEIPNIPIPGMPGSDVPDVPAPPNATTMTCEEYVDLDEATQKAVVRAILAGEGTTDETAEMTAMLLAGAMCRFMPGLTVSEVVSGSPP
jgi:PBP1b-binding outer membrane lipoprotein LpoB